MTVQLRVVFCTHDSPASIGGPFSWLRRLLPSLRDCGIECRVLALTHFGGTGPLVEGLRTDGFDVRVVDCHERTVDDVRWILTQLQDSLPQVFVPNFVVAAYYAARWVKTAGVATVGVLHSDDLFYRAIQREFLFGEKRFRLTDVVSVSEKLHEEASRSMQLNVGCAYIPMGAAVPPAILRDTTRRLRLAYVGRLAEEQKRISLVVRSLDLACREVAGVEAIIYGDGPDRAIVETYLQVHCPDNRVVLAGAISSDRVQAELLQCDAIVLMSDYEGLPIALLEGMACGCIPICRMMNSGIPQLVQHGQTGLLVSDTPQDVVAAVRWLRENPGQASTLSDNARNLIQQQYSHHHCVECWNRLLRCCAGQQQGRLAIPRRIHLPPVNTQLELADRRRPPEPAWRRRLRRLRIQLGAWRRRLLNLGSRE